MNNSNDTFELPRTYIHVLMDIVYSDAIRAKTRQPRVLEDAMIRCIRDSTKYIIDTGTTATSECIACLCVSISKNRCNVRMHTVGWLCTQCSQYNVRGGPSMRIHTRNVIPRIQQHRAALSLARERAISTLAIIVNFHRYESVLSGIVCNYCRKHNCEIIQLRYLLPDNKIYFDYSCSGCFDNILAIARKFIGGLCLRACALEHIEILPEIRHTIHDYIHALIFADIIA